MIRLINVPKEEPKSREKSFVEEILKASSFHMGAEMSRYLRAEAERAANPPYIYGTATDRTAGTTWHRIAGMEINLHPGGRVTDDLMRVVIDIARQIQADNLAPEDFFVNYSYGGGPTQLDTILRVVAVERPRVQHWTPDTAPVFFAPPRRYTVETVVVL